MALRQQQLNDTPTPIHGHQAPGLEALRMLEDLRHTIADQQQELADHLREAGVSWQALGDACGITLQGARSRFSTGRRR